MCCFQCLVLTIVAQNYETFSFEKLVNNCLNAIKRIINFCLNNASLTIFRQITAL